jgi:hypothetical protein
MQYEFPAPDGAAEQTDGHVSGAPCRGANVLFLAPVTVPCLPPANVQQPSGFVGHLGNKPTLLSFQIFMRFFPTVARFFEQNVSCSRKPSDYWLLRPKNKCPPRSANSDFFRPSDLDLRIFFPQNHFKACTIFWKCYLCTRR